MKSHLSWTVHGAIFLLAFGTPASWCAEPAGTAFTYQGLLTDSGSAADGVFDFTFTLHDAFIGGIQLGSPVMIEDVTVSGGLFSVELDFGGEVFTGQARWLEIGVRPGQSEGSHTILAPRLALTPAPYAIHAIGTQASIEDLQNRIAQLETTVGALTTLLEGVTRQGDRIIFSGVNVQVDNGTDSTDGEVNGLGNLIVGYNETRGANDDRSGSHNLVVGARQNFSSYGGLLAGYTNTVSAPYGSASGGFFNVASGEYSSVIAGYNNQASGSYSGVSGGRNNIAEAYYSSVTGGRSNVTSNVYATVGGGRYNEAAGEYTSISGGYTNTAEGDYATVSGGSLNQARGQFAYVAGGGGYTEEEGNQAFADYSSILGGIRNLTGDPNLTDHSIGRGATITGGSGNLASGSHSHVSGGQDNTATAVYASVQGGAPDYDSGWLSLMMGETRTLNHNLGGNPDNYTIDLSFEDDADLGRHQGYFGGFYERAGTSDRYRGGYWSALSDQSIDVYRFSGDDRVERLRLRIWVNN